MRLAGSLSPSSDLHTLLQELETLYPLSTLYVPGPLVPFFKNLAFFTPDHMGIMFGNVTPSIPSSPGWNSLNYFRFSDHTTHLPHISTYLSRFYSVCAAATRDNVTESSFVRDVDGPCNLATIFLQPCDADLDRIATSPGAFVVYAGDLRLWRNAYYHNQTLPLPLPPNLDYGETEVADDWLSALRFELDFNWFSPIAAMMGRNCQFWKNSLSLEDCSANASAAGAVRCRVNKECSTLFDACLWIPSNGNGNSYIDGDATRSATTYFAAPRRWFLTPPTHSWIYPTSTSGQLSFSAQQRSQHLTRCSCDSGPSLPQRLATRPRLSLNRHRYAPLLVSV